jgi:hypothetical protein
MPTGSENTNINPSELVPAGDRKISRQLVDNISGVTHGYIYDSASTTRPQSPLAPNGLIFATTGISNGYASTVSGITNFTAYNDYIHYAPVGAGGSLGGALTGAGITNVASPATRFNVFPNLVRANFRFEIYTRQYRT